MTEESAGRYFGAPVLLRNTNHFTCVKPDSLTHPAHELLVDFWANDMSTPEGHPDMVMDRFVSERLNERLEQSESARMFVMRNNSWFASRREWLMERIKNGRLELEIILPEPSNKNLMTQLRSMYGQDLSSEALAQSIRAVIARLLLMRAALPADRKDKLRIVTHEYYPPYSAYLFDDSELWYIPYHRIAHKLPVFVYSRSLNTLPIYEDFRSLPVWPLTGNQWKHRLGAYVKGLFDDLASRHPSLDSELKNLKQNGAKVYVFGGFVRDSIHAFVHGEQLAPRDLDLVIDGGAGFESKASANHFGGRKWQTDAGLVVDCWDLSSTLAFRRALISPATITNLPRTTVYRLNGCYLSLDDDTIHGEEAIADVFARRVAFNCKGYLTIFPEYQAFRAIDYSERLKYDLDDEVKEFISQTLRAAGPQRFEELIREHRPSIDANLVGDRFDRYSNR